VRVDDPESKRAGGAPAEPEGRGQSDMTRTPPTLEDLVRQPERVTEVARDAVAGLLAEVERLRAGLWARLFDVQERGGTSPRSTRLLTAPTVAEVLGVPVTYVYELARTGRLPAVRFGKYVRFSPEALQAWQARHEAQLDGDLYNQYSSSRDGRGASADPNTARADAGQARGAGRRGRQHHRPAGAQ
jgi:excisionase family DNA binding protein